MSYVFSELARQQFLNGSEYSWLKNMIGRFEKSLPKRDVIGAKAAIATHEAQVSLDSLPEHLKRRDNVACGCSQSP